MFDDRRSCLLTGRPPQLLVLLAALAMPAALSAQADSSRTPDPIAQLVGRLDLERYKATIKGLTRFGDRRQGTDRNRAAVDWIEAQLRSYGCSDVSRLKYDYQPSPPSPDGRGGQGVRTRDTSRASGGGRYRGLRARTGVNTDSLKQPDARLRALDAQASTAGAREEVYCTKIGATHPEEMYIVGAHMDGIGWGEAANDDGSGTALVMELARVFSFPDVRTERSIRFALWNNEETGLNGSRAYVEQRRALQGTQREPQRFHSTRPASICTMRAQRAASSRSCVTRTSVVWALALSSNSSSPTRAPVTVSRLPVGSSANSTAGWVTNARASATRCCSPPESWRG